MVVPSRGSAYGAALHPSAPVRFCKYSHHILLVDCLINCWSSAFTLVASAVFRHLLMSLATANLLFSMSAIHHLFDLVQDLIIFVVVSRTLPIAS